MSSFCEDCGAYLGGYGHYMEDCPRTLLPGRIAALVMQLIPSCEKEIALGAVQAVYRRKGIKVADNVNESQIAEEAAQLLRGEK